MILKEIAQRIDDEGIATLGTNLFVGNMPDETDDALNIVPIISNEQEKDYDLRGENFDVWSRAKSSEVAYNKIMSVRSLLHLDAHFNTASFHCYYLQALTNVEDMDYDSKQRKMYKLSFRLLYRPLAS